MTIKVIKLVTGEDIIAEVLDSGNGIYKLKNPVQISIIPSRTSGEPNFGFLPFPTCAKQSKTAELEIKEAHIIVVTDLAEEFTNQYNSIFGSGIVTPPKSLII